MANQSAKKNQQKIKKPLQILTALVYGATAWLVLWNLYYLFTEQISYWHIIPCAIVALLNPYCLNTIAKYWSLNAIQAAEYHIDILALNIIVSLLDPWTHKVWYIFHYFRHIYWLILIFLLSFVAKWLWAYITPKYEQSQEDGQTSGKKEKKEKKQKVKYVKH